MSGFPQNSQVSLAARAESLAQQGNTVEAQQLVDDYLLQHPDSVPVNVVAGELEAYRHHWERAMHFYEAALHADASNDPARVGERKSATSLALHLRAIQDEEGALDTLEHAHEVLPQDVPLLMNLALQAQAMHRYKQATEAIHQALSLEPQNDRVLYAAAGIAFDSGDSAATAQHYRSFLAQHPDDATAHFGLGRALRIQQQIPEAKRELQRSVALQPVQTEAYYQLGEIALESGQPDEARMNYEKTLSRMPAHAGALTGMGMLTYRAHQYAQAKDILQQAIAAAPDYQAAHYYLGLTLHRLGESDSAEKELRIATELAATQQGKGSPIAAQ